MQPIDHLDHFKKIITIKSSWGSLFGMGHIQRMTTLLWYLNQKSDMKAFIFMDEIPDFFPDNLLQYIKTNIDINTVLIIRDMRDSSVDEIRRLKEISKVMTIDDNGEGRRIADFTVDLLPNTQGDNGFRSRKELFIYGYNFVTGLERYKDREVGKEIDFLIYLGGSSTKDQTGFIISLLPEGSSFVVLKGKDSYLWREGRRYNLYQESYSEYILSSRVIITHFGILLYEGYISGSRLISIDPSPYHARLSELEKGNLSLVNLGEISKLDREKACSCIHSVLRESICKSISANNVYQRAIENLERFYIHLKGLI